VLPSTEKKKVFFAFFPFLFCEAVNLFPPFEGLLPPPRPPRMEGEKYEKGDKDYQTSTTLLEAAAAAAAAVPLPRPSLPDDIWIAIQPRGRRVRAF